MIFELELLSPAIPFHGSSFVASYRVPRMEWSARTNSTSCQCQSDNLLWPTVTTPVTVTTPLSPSRLLDIVVTVVVA